MHEGNRNNSEGVTAPFAEPAKLLSAPRKQVLSRRDIELD